MNSLCKIFGWLFLLIGGLAPALAQGPSPVVNSKQVKVLIDSISNAINRTYIFPDKAMVMTNFLKSEFKRGAYNKLTNPNELANRLRNDLQKINRDPHLGIGYEPEPPTGQAGPAPEETQAREMAWFKANNFFFTRVEVLPGNVGYLSFTRFNHMIKESKPTLNSIFTFLKYTDALIVDLRENHGGSPDMVRQMESYFFKDKTHMMDIVNRPEKKTIELWANPADADSIILSMPVYILTSKGTFSGAEDFSYGMQSVKRAIVIGDTTGGGAHPTGSYNMGNGFVAYIPFARSLNPYTHTDWEGTGVRPDIAVASPHAMEKAIETILTGQLSKATNDWDKNNLKQILAMLKADYDPELVAANVLLQYSGTYEGGLRFYIDGSRFFCQNAGRNNEVFEVKALTQTRFKLDENVIVEFVKGSDGNYSSLNMHWSSGDVSSKKKI